MSRLFIVFSACLFCFDALAAVEVQNPSVYQHPGSGLTVFAASVDLPSDGTWTVVKDTQSTLTEVFLTPGKETREWKRGNFLAKQEDQRRVQQGRYPLSQLYQNIIQFATTHEGMTPTSL
ncbi:MAG TPA: hypothetical protein ENI74_07355, partial [Gammaproteobacteria bacterium]|nr:hypothetical protein [Gammaproteobacteria bacterium]